WSGTRIAGLYFNEISQLKLINKNIRTSLYIDVTTASWLGSYTQYEGELNDDYCLAANVACYTENGILIPEPKYPELLIKKIKVEGATLTYGQGENTKTYQLYRYDHPWYNNEDGSPILYCITNDNVGTNPKIRGDIDETDKETRIINGVEKTFIKDQRTNKYDINIEDLDYSNITNYQVFHYRNTLAIDPRALLTTEFKDNFVETVIRRCKMFKMNTVWFDNTNALTIPEGSVPRPQWIMQNFLHYVIEKLHEKNIKVIANMAGGTLDGSRSYGCNFAPIIFDPFWTVDKLDNYQINTARGDISKDKTLGRKEQFSNNTVDNTPDVLFREYSFYSQDNYKPYWLKCLNDAEIVNNWNKKIPNPNKQKKIQYSFYHGDFDWFANSEPIPNNQPWVMWGLCSYLLCYNKYTELGISNNLQNNFEPIEIDFDMISKLGKPIELHKPVDGQDDPYFRYRTFKNNEGKTRIVIVNAYKWDEINAIKTYTIPMYCIDQTGKSYNKNDVIEIQPFTGLILLEK
ncbi:MAG: hypothetical protein SNJ71_05335, partial [Bacteroidales bacterium]